MRGLQLNFPSLDWRLQRWWAQRITKVHEDAFYGPKNQRPDESRLIRLPMRLNVRVCWQNNEILHDYILLKEREL